MQVGNCVSPQLALRVNSAEAAVAAMKNEAFLIETKFDGNRIQVRTTQATCAVRLAARGVGRGARSEMQNRI
jgi:ATP-dependent DNA ligase